MSASPLRNSSVSETKLLCSAVSLQCIQDSDSDEEDDEAEPFAWRMVVEVATGLKLVCCRGRCPGAPRSIPPIDPTSGFQQVLLNATADKFDMHPIDDERAAARLRAQLPPSFRCGEVGALSAVELVHARSMIPQSD